MDSPQFNQDQASIVMAAATVWVFVMAAISGTSHSGAVATASDCIECGTQDAKLQADLVKLRTSSHWIVRRKAARSLRNYNWKRHPEVVIALADAVRSDRQCLVRQESAVSLKKMRPCLMEAHEALACAAENDPSLIARHAAKKALMALGKTCDAPCQACDPLFDGEPIFESERFLEPGLDFETLPSPPYEQPPLFQNSPEFYPETSLDPLTPTSFQMPAAPIVASPFATDGGSRGLPPPRRVPPPKPRGDDDLPPISPERPLDPYAQEVQADRARTKSKPLRLERPSMELRPTDLLH